MNTLTTGLGAVIDLLSDADSWTQGAAARDKDGNSVRADSPDAVKWCLVGAALQVDPDDSEPIAAEIHWACQAMYNMNEVPFNDAPGRTHEEILAFLRDARDLAIRT